MTIPGYIRDRLLRPIPPDCCVALNTWPVIANGDPGLAKIATVGLNPGGGAPYNDATVEEVWDGQKRYFLENRYRYFTPLEHVLNACGASYGGKYDPDGNYAISACNPDLVCWATTPHWSNVPYEAQRKLLDADHEFFTTLLAENPNIELLLGNGRTVGERMMEKFGVEKIPASDIHPRLVLYCGEAAGKLFIGWSTFLGNSPLKREQRDAMARRVSEMAAERGVRP